MPEHVESVNGVAAFFRDQAKNANAAWKARFDRFADQMEATSKELVRLYGLTTALPPDLGNVHDLPPDLLEELSISKGDELDDQLVTVVNSYGGEASLDQILVGLFRKFGVKQKRRFLQNKLYRMPMIWSVEGRKGIYTTSEPDDGDSGCYSPPVDETEETPASYLHNQRDLDDEIPF